jgi:hypothetical protein
MNKSGKAKGVTYLGCIILILIGVVFLSQSGSDPTGVVFWIGLLCVVFGLIGLALLLIKEFT